MWLTKFGEYVCQGWKEAALLALIFSLIPFLGWVAVVIMALVTLRKGPKQGALILIIACLPTLVLLYVGKDTPWIMAVLMGNILTWILATTLRQQAAWGAVLTILIAVSLLVGLTLHLIVPDLYAYWFQALNNAYQSASKETVLLWRIPENVSPQVYLQGLAKVVTPMLILSQAVISMVCLVLARCWQASLFNPGGFAKEISETRLSYIVVLFAILVLAAIFGGIQAGWDVLPTVLFAFFWVGIVVFHSIIKPRKAKTAWLWLFYVLLVLLFPYSLIIVAGLGITDTFVNFRARLAQ